MTLRADVTVDKLNERCRGTLPALLGFRVVALEQGLLVAEIDIRAELLAGNGFLHAGTVVTLADTACGYGCLAHLPKGADSFTTVELKSNFIGTAREGSISCIACPAHLGNTTQVWDGTVSRHHDGKSIAFFRCTQIILWPKSK